MKTAIPGYPGYYASPLGVIYGKRGKPLKGHEDKAGYIKHILLVVRGGKRIKTMKYAHRLIAITFLPNPQNKRTVNHKDGIKHHNLVNNLEWATYEEQVAHSYNVLGNKPHHCVWKGKRGINAAYCNTVILKRGDTEVKKGSQRDIAEYLGYSQQYIHRIIKEGLILSGNYSIIKV